MSKEFKTIGLDLKEDRTILVLNRLPLNIVNLEMLEELSKALDIATNRNAVLII
jgi:enoyl-CoA hydratase/carnithine racemase